MQDLKVQAENAGWPISECQIKSRLGKIGEYRQWGLLGEKRKRKKKNQQQKQHSNDRHLCSRLVVKVFKCSFFFSLA